jgi:predicted esterase
MLHVIVLHGWTDTAKNLKNVLEHFLPSQYTFHFLSAPHGNSEWFEYAYDRNDTLFGRHDLEYKAEHQLVTSIRGVHAEMEKYADATRRNIFLVGTSQGATLAFHALASYPRSSSLAGAWLHNTAGVYESLLPGRLPFVTSFQGTRHTGGHALDLANGPTFTSFVHSLYLTRLNRKSRITVFYELVDPVIHRSIAEEANRIIRKITTSA